MSILRALLNTRSRYLAVIAALLVLVLVLVAVRYGPWSASRAPGFLVLTDTQRAWLQEQSVLRIAGRWEEPPFAFYDEGGGYRGYEIDLAESLGPVLGVGIEIVPMPQHEAVVAMANGEIDAIMGMAQDAQSSDRFYFTEPYVASSLSIFVRAETLDVTTLEDLQDDEVAVQADTAAEAVLSDRQDVSLILVQSAEEGLQLLADGAVSAFVADEIVGLRAAQIMGLDKEIKLVGLPSAVVNYGIAVPKTDDAWLGVLNHGLASMEAVGLKQQVDRAWFGAPVSAVAAGAASSTVTIGLGIIVCGLVLGNAVYFLQRFRRRSKEYSATIQESQKKYQRLVEGTDEAIFSISGDSGILEVNSRMEALTGYRRDELLTMSLDDLVIATQRHTVRNCMDRVLGGGTGELDDVSLLNRRGDAVPVQLSAHLVSDAGRRIIQCIAHDVRERKRMRHQVLRRSADLSAIGAIAEMVSQLPDLEEVLDKALGRVLDLTQMQAGVVYLRGSRDGEMIPVVKRGLNEELMRDVDWPQGPRKLADEVGERAQVLISGGSGPAMEPSVPWAAGAGVGTHIGVPLSSKDQVHGVLAVYGLEPRRFTEEDTALLGAIGSQLGVAIENARMFHQLQRTASDMGAMRQFSDSILQNMTNGLVVIDREGKVGLVNRTGERMLGCKEEEVVGSPVEEILGFGAETVRDSLERALVYSGKEIVVKREGGESIPLGMSVSPLRDDEGKLNGVVVMLSDLREAKALEEERRRLDRLSVLGEISAVMAHEIRNPLAGIGAGIQHLATKFEEGDERRGAMERILRESERVNRIIEDILLISRPPHLNLAPCDISEVVEEAVSSWEEKASEQGVEIKKYYASGVPPIRGDGMRLHQALSNLILNGIEAMPNGGELSVAVTGPGGLTGGGEGSALEADSGYVEIEIRDTGFGIKEEEIERVFEPFYTTKPRETGLGLPITRRIINEHGGEVEVESKEGTGTRFIVRLPLARRGG